MVYLLCIMLSLLSFGNTGPGKERYVLNKGVPGNNVTNLLRRLDRAVLKHKPSLVIVMIGTNDMVNPRKMLSYNEYERQLNALVTRIKQGGA